MHSRLFSSHATRSQKKSLQGEAFLEAFSFKLSAVFENPQAASVVFEALHPEIGGRHEKRSSTILSRHGETLVLSVSALDKKALRASINSYLKLFDLSLLALEVI
ncbi:MAG: KEOPS complex subunit Pcc1 [archaeon]|nr:KEOPS complex subunit Pcc1 [archaeon]